MPETFKVPERMPQRPSPFNALEPLALSLEGENQGGRDHRQPQHYGERER
jgi:hypothetical protein